jgi:4'-phosphopantetheinyl transferase
MPLEFINDDGKHSWGIWKILEDETQLQSIVQDRDRVPENISHEKKRLEFLAGRALLKTLLKNWDIDYHGLTKDIFGKPFFNVHAFHLSLSHSFPYVAAVIDRRNPVGIDLEQPKPKLLSIAARVLSSRELSDAGDDLLKHCILWCAKECLVKVHGKKDLVFAKNIQIEPFTRHKSGDLIGRIVAIDCAETVPMHYRVYDNFVIVVTTS